MRSEFCGMVRKIFIYTREEVQKMNPGTALARAEEPSASSDEKSTLAEAEPAPDPFT